MARIRTGTGAGIAAAVVAAACALAACSSGSSGSADSSAPPSAVSSPTPTSAATTSQTPTPSTSIPATSAPATTPSATTPTTSTRPASTSRSATTPKIAPKTASVLSSLPVAGSTGSASQVITVAAPSTSSTTATVQAWTKVSGGWRRSGSSISARLGSDGLSRHASESESATPIGSFTLTQAFGHDADPGTSLPYFRTTAADWWISQSGPLYNTHQHCSSDCAFTRGDPNEHLADELPFYDYAVVIDYNTSNSPGGVQAGRGSAFFLHVTVDPSTQGCVSVPKASLVRLMRWLSPTHHPRIVIGTS